MGNQRYDFDWGFRSGPKSAIFSSLLTPCPNRLVLGGKIKQKLGYSQLILDLKHQQQIY